MSKTIEELCTELDAKIPRDVISLRDGGGRKLSYLETHYVIDRLNKVLGNLNWSNTLVDLKQVREEPSTYIAKVRLDVVLPDGRVVSKEGIGYGADKNKLNPHEMATKEAESDALKRAAKNLGMSMGLALYSKEQENVSDEKEEAASAHSAQAAKAGGPAKAAEKQSAAGAGNSGGPAPIQPKSVEGSNGQSNASSKSGTEARAELDMIIKSKARVVVAKKAKTMEELKAHLQEKYGVQAAANLSDAQAREFEAFLASFI